MAQISALPKYIQISERLIREIAAGHLTDGARLPPERKMAQQLQISVGTLRKALDDLQSKGLLERVQGSGNYIRQKADVDSIYSLFRLEAPSGAGLPDAQVLSVDHLAKPDGAPNFGPSDSAHRIRRLRLLDGNCVALEEIWLDDTHGCDIAATDLSASLYQFYQTRLGLVIATVTDRIGVEPVPDWTPQAFGLAVGDPAGHVARLGKPAEGGAVEYSNTWFDPARARYVSRLGRG